MNPDIIRIQKLKCRVNNLAIIMIKVKFASRIFRLDKTYVRNAQTKGLGNREDESVPMLYLVR